MTETHNVEHGEGKPSSMDWITFKERLKTYRGWDYDEETKQFYFMHRGSRNIIEYQIIIMLACAFGHYEDLTEYLECQ